MVALRSLKLRGLNTSFLALWSIAAASWATPAQAQEVVTLVEGGMGVPNYESLIPTLENEVVRFNYADGTEKYFRIQGRYLNFGSLTIIYPAKTCDRFGVVSGNEIALRMPMDFEAQDYILPWVEAMQSMSQTSCCRPPAIHDYGPWHIAVDRLMIGEVEIPLSAGMERREATVANFTLRLQFKHAANQPLTADDIAKLEEAIRFARTISVYSEVGDLH